ncbi:hypothetical protein BKP37_10710 [Anaerobacillus alkalilacustris]|uniref:Nitrite/sulphite reductase 4Fe-4S domain-containing protein n=1 Tax=Anaerobacillus alkalilacustris TaxID=393763 RepID=A0A1S2LPV5_9BACI|nr:hypothetical protein [Anaerobacillus alkalilacustris]OIJ13435.1 hypothetical protein BKP37_10710 [Anaerobacillus alkalilacustris]
MLSEEIFFVYPPVPKNFIGYAVSCTGSEYYNYALVETKVKMKEIATYLDDQMKLDIPVRIHVVGCPSSCGQRHIADIGLQGCKMKMTEAGLVEAFELYVGGTLDSKEACFNKKLKGRISAENIQEVLRDILIFFKNEKKVGENFYQFVKRVGINTLQEKLDEALLTVEEQSTLKAR